jgi:anti-sigma regulatory factor (Ser/Thr protein kinase)
LTQTRAQFVIRDQGPGFDITKLPSPTDPNNISYMGQRGLTLIRNFMDDVSFKENGAEIHMSVSFKPSATAKG